MNSLVAETLANDPDFIQAGFHIGRFIIAMVDRLNIEGLLMESKSWFNRIKVNSPCIITSSFRSELN
jgi:hypothetical protein